MRLYYYFVDAQGHQHGPVPKSYFKLHPLNGHSWVWHYGLPQWVEAHTVPSIRRYVNSNLPRSYSDSSDVIDYEKEKYKTPHGQVLTSAAQADMRVNVPKTWMLEAILTTLFCCFPFGLVAIFYSSKVVSYWRRGLFGESVGASLTAELWTKLSFAVSILLWLVYFFLYIFTPVTEKTIIWYNNIM